MLKNNKNMTKRQQRWWILRVLYLQSNSKNKNKAKRTKKNPMKINCKKKIHRMYDRRNASVRSWSRRFLHLYSFCFISEWTSYVKFLFVQFTLSLNTGYSICTRTERPHRKNARARFFHCARSRPTMLMLYSRLLAFDLWWHVMRFKDCLFFFLGG